MWSLSTGHRALTIGREQTAAGDLSYRKRIHWMSLAAALTEFTTSFNRSPKLSAVSSAVVC